MLRYCICYEKMNFEIGDKNMERFSPPINYGDDDEDDDDDDTYSNDSNNDPNYEPQLGVEETAHFENIHNLDNIDMNYCLQSKNDEKLDIHATLEHLVITGNYYRHQQWRMKQWQLEQLKKHELQNTATSDHISTNINNNTERSGNNNDNVDIEGDNTNIQTRPKRTIDADSIVTKSIGNDENNNSKKKKSKNTNDSINISIETQKHILHAQDARIYNNEAMEPDPWPKTLTTLVKEAPVLDHRWVEEFSDPYMDNPITFTKLRLSGLIHNDNNNNDTNGVFEPFVSTDGNHHANTTTESNINSDDNIHSECTTSITSDTAARALLLHCWERAVHVASTTIEVSQPSSKSSSTSSSIKINKYSPDEAVRLCQLYDIIEENNNGRSIETEIRNENISEREPQHRHVHVCSVCERQFDEKEHLLNHFYGINTMDFTGNSNSDYCCCWSAIEKKRRTITASILECEVTSQIDQLLRLIMQLDLTTSLSKIKASTTLIDGFDVLKMMEQYVSTSRKVKLNGATDVVQETLEVSAHEPPLPVNAAILEAVRYRLVDRYGMIPR